LCVISISATPSIHSICAVTHGLISRFPWRSEYNFL
jgi:hypothetical protein